MVFGWISTEAWIFCGIGVPFLLLGVALCVVAAEVYRLTNEASLDCWVEKSDCVEICQLNNTLGGVDCFKTENDDGDNEYCCTDYRFTYGVLCITFGCIAGLVGCILSGFGIWTISSDWKIRVPSTNRFTVGIEANNPGPVPAVARLASNQSEDEPVIVPAYDYVSPKAQTTEFANVNNIDSMLPVGIALNQQQHTNSQNTNTTDQKTDEEEVRIPRGFYQDENGVWREDR